EGGANLRAAVRPTSRIRARSADFSPQQRSNVPPPPEHSAASFRWADRCGLKSALRCPACGTLDRYKEEREKTRFGHGPPTSFEGRAPGPLPLLLWRRGAGERRPFPYFNRRAGRGDAAVFGPRFFLASSV